MDEEWRAFRKYYEVSNLGRVRRAVGGVNTHKGRIKKLTKKPHGYYVFGFCIDGGNDQVLVHKAIAECFIGPRPDGMQINHKDGNKGNNCADNLEYVTPSGNMEHASENDLLPTGNDHWARRKPEWLDRGDDHWTRRLPHLVKRGNENGAHLHPECILRGSQVHKAKLVESQVKEILTRHGGGECIRSLANAFGVTYQNINFIVTRKTWRHVNV